MNANALGMVVVLLLLVGGGGGDGGIAAWVTLMSVETMFLLVTMVFDDVGSRLWLISSAISVVSILSKQTLVDNPLHMLGSMIER